MSLYTVYCDESCHLENDGQTAMALGAVWAPRSAVAEINADLRMIKRTHGVAPHIELKWVKISPRRVSLYNDVVSYFFDNNELHFRTLVIPDKTQLDHSRFEQTHDDWYYKMYFHLLEVILSPHDQYEIYIDIKDTHGGRRLAHLSQVLANSKYDFSFSIVKRMQTVRSHEVQLLQLTDVLLGAVSAANRGDTKSLAKQQIISLVQQRSGYNLSRSTLLREDKFNIFRWTAQVG